MECVVENCPERGTHLVAPGANVDAVYSMCSAHARSWNGGQLLPIEDGKLQAALRSSQRSEPVEKAATKPNAMCESPFAKPPTCESPNCGRPAHVTVHDGSVPHDLCVTCHARFTSRAASGGAPRTINVAPMHVVASDPINHPKHYNSHPSGVEAIVVIEHFNFCLGNAIKYIWRAGLKDSSTTLEDLHKAEWYLKREIARLEKGKT